MERENSEVQARKIIEEMIKGYGDKFIGLEELMKIEPTPEQIAKLLAPVPAMGRNRKSCAFLDDVTSGKAVGLTRFRVGKEYFIALNGFLTNYKGHGDKEKIVSGLSPEDIQAVRLLGLMVLDVFRAEQLEAVAEHDTAAAMDYLKILMAEQLPHLTVYIEAMHFAITSEDNMGNVFGLIGNRLVYGYFMGALVDYCQNLIAYCRKHGSEKPVYLPGLTHQQGAEPDTLDIITANTIESILGLLACLANPFRVTFPFSGKMGGAIGTLLCHYAAYPDGDWIGFGQKFVTGLDLHYTHRTNQSVTYAREAQILTTIANILTQVIKNTEDFISHASCPSQFFVKVKKAGTKGSSIMPNKSNAWKKEGGDAMLAEARDMLYSLARRLPEYPHQGDMARSYPLRNLGAVFAPVFTALGRLSEERNDYVPNYPKIDAFFHEYPGMSGSALQTVLKRMAVPGDAYREIQEISINPDGTYANQEQFVRGLAAKIDKFGLDNEHRDELMMLMEREHLLRKPQATAVADLERYSQLLGNYKKLSEKMKAPTY
jgi:adenylosuccinate lyase